MAEPKYTICSDETLFQPTTIKPAYPWFTLLTLGIINLHYLPMEQDTIYLLDVGYHNDIFVYTRETARNRRKLLWKLNLPEALEMKAVSVPSRIDLVVDLPGVPSFDKEFGGGAWVKIDYKVRCKVKISPESIAQVHHAKNPLTTVQNAALRAARLILPFTSYQEALIAAAEKEIQKTIMEDLKVQATGLNVDSVEVESITSNKQVETFLQQSFERLRRAKDKREIALLLSTIDDTLFRRALENEAPPEKALEYRSRAANQVLEALLALGSTPLQIYQTMGGAARELGQPNQSERTQPLGNLVAAQAFRQIDWTTIPSPPIPLGLSHENRLQWERQVAEERVPTQFQSVPGEPDAFCFRLETGHLIKIVWTYAEFPPQVYINGERRDDYASLKPGLYDYRKTTIWDLYLETRRKLDV